MKIGPLESKPPVAAATPAATDKKAAPAAAANATTTATTTATTAAMAQASAQVELSPAASLLSGLASDPSFDAAKVERIAQAIRDGKFEINAEAIADKLIVNAQELLGRKPS